MISKLRQPYFIYLIIVSVIGLFLTFVGIISLFDSAQLLNYILLLILASVTEIVTTSIQVSDKSGITYHIGPAVAMASIPFYGPLGAIVIVVVDNLSLWLIKPAKEAKWRKSWPQLAFNSGMESIAMFVAGGAFLLLRDWFGVNTFLGKTIPWFIAAIMFDQLNLLLLIGILRLQHGKELNPWDVWKENRWAASISALVFGLGAAVLSIAIERFDWVGIVIFFLPLFLSAFALRLYIQRVQAHMGDLESIVAERTQELAKLIKDKDAFLAVLSHDMKTPLTSINIYASIIQSYPHKVIEKPELAEAILKSQKTLTEIVDNILDLEKMQVEGVVSMKKENLDLANLVEITIAPLKAQAEEKGINLRYEIDKQPMFISVDGHQIQRVIQNLVSNAIKYTPQAGHVFIRIYRDKGYSVIKVEDDGYGIPDEELPYVFDRYHRVAEHKNIAAGTGLGLAIAKAIVEAHNGFILVSHREGGGSIFQFGLPV